VRTPSLSLTLASYGPLFRDPTRWPELLDHARMAEAAGVDRILLTDHVVMGERTDAYPGVPFRTAGHALARAAHGDLRDGRGDETRRF
jgi:alkanesulfonate monooxygenase SsuD/methylene tetrahydromethanopterin reductase-like flavin-dependent oxidoreductase (luciferase family)